MQVGNMLLQHRIALFPLTRNRADDNHVPIDIMTGYYTQRSSRRGTMPVTEGTLIARRTGGQLRAPGIWSGDQIAPWEKVFDRIHTNKSFAFPALGEHKGEDSLSASDVPLTGRPAPRLLTVNEINEYVQSYADGAKNAIAAGADGVEIHSGNGYLLDQFLHANSNKRTDEYGGTIENRARFILEIVHAVVEAIGAELVALRLSPWSTFGEVDPGVSPIPQFSYVAAEVERRARKGKRLAYISLVEPQVKCNLDLENWDGSNEFIAQIWSGPLMRAGAMHRKEMRDAALKDDRSIIAMVRAFIANPDLVNRLENGIELNPYDRSTFYGRTTLGYTDYPFAS